jgi:hypothetical protein
VKVETTPTPRVLLSVRSRKWNPAEALAELIDNSFGEARGNAKNVWVNVDRRKHRIEIIDDGVGCDDIADLFTLGKGAHEADGDIGRYGVGGSEALLWLGDKVTVTSLRKNKVSSTTVDWGRQLHEERFPIVDNGWRPATAVNTPEELLDRGQGTYILIHLHKGVRLPQDGDKYSGLRKPIGRLFAPGLLNKRSIIWNDEKLDAWQLPIDADRGITFNVDVPREDGPPLTAGVLAGPAVEGETISVDNSRMAIWYAYRTVEYTRDCYDGYTGAGLAGYVVLGSEWRQYITTTKDGFADDNLRAALMEKVEAGLMPLLERLREEQVSKLFAKIALKLQASLSGMFKPDPEGEEEEPTKQGDGQHPRGEGDRPLPEIGDEDDPKRKGEYAATAISIEGLSKDEMAGVLVRIVFKPQEIVAQIDKDDRHVETALVEQPTNAMLLAALITQEIARLLAQTPDKLITYRIMTRRRLEELQADHPEPMDLLPFVYAKLLDGVRSAT